MAHSIRILTAIFMLVFLISLSSCKDNTQGIDMIYTDFFNIQAGANTFDTHYFQSGLMSAKWSDFLGDLQPDDISTITPSFARISNRNGIPMSFISQVVIEIYPDENTTLTPWEMAHRGNVPLNTGTTLNIIPGLVNFKDELSNDRFIYRIGLRYRQFPPASFKAVLDFGFKAQTK